MLIFERTHAHLLAYDRITPKMIRFLSKYFLLNNYITQNNGFVLYDSYFKNKSHKGLSDVGAYILTNSKYKL